MSDLLNPFRKPRTFYRPQTGGDNPNTGKYEPDPSPLEITINASLQPVTGEELKQLPEGRRTDQTYKLYSSVQFKTLKEGIGQQPDYTIIDGFVFEVIMSQRWGNDVINHYKAIIAKTNKTKDIGT